MEKMEAFRRAVAEIGYESAEKLSSFVAAKYGVKIEPRYIPLCRASLEDLKRNNRLPQGKAPILEGSNRQFRAT